MRRTRARDAGYVLAGNLLQKLSAGAREVALAYGFGAEAATDVYLAGMAVPGLLFGVTSAALTPALIPTWHRLGRKPEAKTEIFGFFNGIMIVSIVLGLAVALLAPHLLGLMYPGFSSAERAQTGLILWVFLPGAWLSLLLAFWSALAQAEGDFATPSLSPVPGNLLAAALIVWLARDGILLAAAAGLLSQALQVLIFWPSARRLLEGWRPVVSLRPALVKSLWAAAPFAVAATLLGQGGAFVARYFASGMAQGTLAAWNFGGQAAFIPLSLVTGTVITVMVPRISQSAAGGDEADLASQTLDTLSAILFIALPLSLFFFVYGRELVQLAFLRGAYAPRAIDLTAKAFIGFSVGLFLLPVGNLLTRMAYIHRRPACVAGSVAAGVIVAAVFDAWLAPTMGVMGLALATSIGHVAQVGVIWSLLVRTGQVMAPGAVLRRLEPTLWALVPSVPVLALAHRVAPTPMGAALGGGLFGCVFLAADHLLGGREATFLRRLGSLGVHRLLHPRTG